MLSFAEEIYLLALDDVSGKMSTYSDEVSLSYALIGATLCELSFLGKVDTDIDHLYVLDKTPVGNKVLDSILTILATNKSNMPISYWLKVLLSNANETEELVLSELTHKGVLRKVDEKILWVFNTRRYPLIDNKDITNVEERIRQLVLRDGEIPDPRDTVLVSLIYACNLFPSILSPKEVKRTENRIKMLAKLDSVGREVVDMIEEIKSFSPSIFCNTPI